MHKRFISSIFLIAYSALVVKLLILKEASFTIGHLMFNFSGQATGQANFVPFKTIVPYLLGQKGWMIAIFNLVGNIVLFVPIGFLVVFIYRKIRWQTSLILAVAAPLVIEGVQVLFGIGIFDIDDVILNGLGIMIGYWLFRIFAGYIFNKKI